MDGKKLMVNVVDYAGSQTKQLEYSLGQKAKESIIDLADFPRGMYIIHAQVGHLKKSLKVVR
jgi:hypothetical protein